mmetsp:Transcript_1627/g.3790  ORF Transcript_1627/g.3790 Transcript_1627/m.3790 type:complete len:547 (-) Transcript_1627:311-1951(-)
MTGEKEDAQGTGENASDDVDNKKRKAESSADESPEQDNEVTASRAKRQKQEEPESTDVDNNSEADTKAEEEKKEPIGDEQNDAGAKSVGESDSKTDEEKDNTPITDNDVKDMEIEGNKHLSSEAANGEDGDKENEDDTKDASTSSANGGKKAPKTDETNEETSNGDNPSSSSNANKTGDEAKTKNKSANPYDNLKYIMVRNDGKPESLIKLVALKSLFSRQLPKMPRTYIARLVFDRKHISLVILNDDPATKDTDEEVIGSICYRPFKDMRFAEIAFCAVNASHQVKGYGTKLMNLVKKEGARTGIEYFITYADNYAIGYFKKQGFTKTISMPKGRYQGLIKEYDGGTMMECYVHPSIDFTRIPEMLKAQREFILKRIKLKALSHKVTYDPLPKNWKPHLEGVSRANESAARALAVPGMIEAGWTIADLIATTGQGKDLDRAKNALKSELMAIVRKVEDQQFSWPFREPVDTNEVKDYLDVIKEPIDLLTIDKRIRKGEHYKSKKMLYADLMLMVNNCKLYNDEASTYVQCAMNLERFLKALFAPK